LAYARFTQEYQKSAVNGASPLQLIVMLYDGALRFMEAGKHAMQHGERDKQNETLQRAQKIVLELMGCLDMEKGGDIAKNLFSLYSYVINELVTSNIKDEPAGIDRSMKVISDLRESWVQLEASTSGRQNDYEERLAA
jgi:flagellar protein FliS